MKKRITVLTGVGCSLLVLAGCSERQVLTEPQAPAPLSGSVSQRIACKVTTASRSVQCSSPSEKSAASMSVVLGGQGTYVELASTSVSYNGGTEIFQANVTVKNLTAQPMGTTDGTTLDPAGIQVFFHSGPTVATGTGVVTVANADGTGTFTGSNQPYFQYNQVLGANATSSTKTWQWNVPVTVVTFEFEVLVQTALPAEQGVLRWATMVAPMNANRLTGVWASSATDAFAVGTLGTIRHFDGVSWSDQATPVAFGLNGVWGSSGTDVFAVGALGTILHYDGTSWTAQTSGTNLTLAAVGGTSSTDVWAVGWGPLITGSSVTQIILHYNGTSWSVSHSATGSNPQLTGILAQPGGYPPIVMAGSGLMIYSGGIWGPWAVSPPASFVSLWGTPSDLYAASRTSVWHYDGINWTSEALPAAYPSLAAAWGTGASNDFFALTGDANLGHPNFFVLYFDGVNWVEQVSGIYALGEVWGRNGSDVFAVGNDGTVMHYDGGNWSFQVKGSTLWDVWGSSATDVFAVGNNGIIRHFDGLSWSDQASGTLAQLLGVWGSGPTDVYAVGAGVVLHYDGLTWGPVSTGVTPAPPWWDVWGSSATDVFMVSEGANSSTPLFPGVIAHFDGVSWTTQSSSTNDAFYGVWGAGPGDVFAVGLDQLSGDATIRHFNGATWSPQTNPGVSPLRVWGSSGTNVYATNFFNAPMKYNGSNWATETLPTSIAFGAVGGLSASDVYIVGGSGRIAHYNGASWTMQTSGTTSALNGVWGSSPANVFVVGGGGIILRGTR